MPFEKPIRSAALPGNWFGVLRPFLACLLVAGCASTAVQPDTALSFTVPATWSESSNAAGQQDLLHWWTRFNDPELNGLVGDALNNNLAVKSARATLRQAWALRDIADAALLPTLDGTASVQRNRSPGLGTNNQFQVGAAANWVPDIFGAARSGRAAAEAVALSDQASLGDMQVAIAAEVGLNYIALRSAQARFDIALGNIRNQEETLQLTQWRQQAGLLTALEVEQASSALDQTRAQLPALQIIVVQSQHALALLTGQPPNQLSMQLSEVQPVPRADDSFALSIPAETLRQRADVQAAEFNVVAAQQRVNQATAARLPAFSLGGSIGLSALTAAALTNGASVVSGLAAGVTLPVFDGGARRAEVDLQQAAQTQAQLAYQTTVLTALSDVENALIALKNDRQRLISLSTAGASAASASQLARQRYGSGLIDFQVVLQTQLTQLLAQDAVALANADVSSDQVRLIKALGGGWQPDRSDGPISTPISTKTNQANPP